MESARRWADLRNGCGPLASKNKVLLCASDKECPKLHSTNWLRERRILTTAGCGHYRARCLLSYGKLNSWRASFVSRILYGAALASLRRDDHSSSPGLATGIERPTRGFILPCRLLPP